MKSDRGAEGIDQTVGGGGAVEILHNYWELVHSEREPRAQEHEQDHGKHQCEGQRAPVADDLGQLFSRLRDDSPHACSWLRLNGYLALQARSFDDGDEHVFERESVFASADHMQPMVFQAFGSLLDRDVWRVLRDQVKAFAKEGDPPTLRAGLQQIYGALRLVDDRSGR